MLKTRKLRFIMEPVKSYFSKSRKIKKNTSLICTLCTNKMEHWFIARDDINFVMVCETCYSFLLPY